MLPVVDGESVTPPRATWCVRNPKLPLAVYRDLAAHLGQVEGVQVEEIPATPERFNYTLSQVAGLTIGLPSDPIAQQQVESILAYYGDRYRSRYGSWQRPDAAENGEEDG